MQNGNNYDIMQKIIKLPKWTVGFWKKEIEDWKSE